MTIAKYEYPTNVSIDGESCTRVVEIFIDESGEEHTSRYFITTSGRIIGGEED